MTTLRGAAQQALEALEYDNPAGRTATITALRAALAEPVQEPVAWRFQSAVGGWAYGSEPPLGSKYPAYPLYTAPPQRKPLTEEEIINIGKAARAVEGSHILPVTFARAIEQAHGIGGQND